MALISVPLAALFILVSGLFASFLPQIIWYRNQVNFRESIYAGQTLIQRLPEIFFHWDTGWYTTIAIHGYREDAMRLAFFPAWPTLLSLFKPFVGNKPKLIHLAATPLGIIFWTLAFLIWRKVAERIPTFQSSEKKWLPWLFAFYPTSLFCIVGYPDALFLFAAGSFLYSVLSRNAWLIFFSTGLLILTKHVGIIVASLTLSWMLFYRRREFVFALLGFALSLGAVSYLSWSIAGSPISWYKMHGLWGRHFGLPHLVFVDLIGKGGVEMIFYAVFLFLGPLFLFLRVWKDPQAENILALSYTLGILLPAWFSSSALALYRILYLVPFLIVMLSEWLDRRRPVTQYLFVALFIALNFHATYRFVTGVALP